MFKAIFLSCLITPNLYAIPDVSLTTARIRASEDRFASIQKTGTSVREFLDTLDLPTQSIIARALKSTEDSMFEFRAPRESTLDTHLRGADAADVAGRSTRALSIEAILDQDIDHFVRFAVMEMGELPRAEIFIGFDAAGFRQVIFEVRPEGFTILHERKKPANPAAVDAQACDQSLAGDPR